MERGGISRSRIGRRGERIAARALRRRGYRVLERNLRRGHGEVDLVCLRGGTVVLCEVKTRSEGASTDPLAATGGRKRRRVVAAGHRWMRERACGDLPYRLALVIVTLRRWPLPARVEVLDPLEVGAAAS